MDSGWSILTSLGLTPSPTLWCGEDTPGSMTMILSSWYPGVETSGTLVTVTRLDSVQVSVSVTSCHCHNVSPQVMCPVQTMFSVLTLQSTSDTMSTASMNGWAPVPATSRYSVWTSWHQCQGLFPRIIRTRTALMTGLRNSTINNILTSIPEPSTEQ